MLQNYLWVIYALGASILWGVQYATIEQLSKSIPVPLITLGYTVSLGLVYSIGFIWFRPELEFLHLKSYLVTKNLLLFGLVVIVGTISTLLIFSAISQENATKASLIEISYPFFVALFAALLYREDPLNWQTLIGGMFMLLGGMIVLQA